MNTSLILANAPAQPNAGFGQFLPLIIIFAIFYFAIIRPQQRREKERKAQISTLRAGAQVLLTGGILGTVEEVREKTFVVRTAGSTLIEVVQGAVDRVIPTADNKN